MGFKIQPSIDGSLCATCRDSQIVDFADGKSVVHCHTRGAMKPIAIRGPVVRCNDYDDRRLAAKWDMEKIAWIVTTDKSGKTIGFAPPKKD
jgi:hypothetical protein